MTHEIVFPSVTGSLPEPVRHSEKDRAASFEPEGGNGRLAETCSEFESYFIHHLIKQMRATIPKSDLFGNRKSEEMYTSIMDMELARDLAEKGGIGLAAMLSRRLMETASFPPKGLPINADNKVESNFSVPKGTVTEEKAVRE